MRGLIHFSLRQNVLMNLLFVAVTLFAVVFALPSMPVDRFPNFSFGEATVTVRYPGASAEDVERLVTKPLEDAIRGMDDIEFVRASSIRGQAELQIKFIDDTDYDKLYSDLQLRVLQTQNRLPSVNGKPLQPVFAEVETDQWMPVLQVSLQGNGSVNQAGHRQLTLLAEELRVQLERVEGVKRVDLWGDEQQQYNLILDPKRVREAGTTLTEVANALSAAGIETPAGRLSDGIRENALRISGRFRSNADLDNVVIRIDGNGNPLLVGQLVDHAASGAQRIDGGMIISMNGLDSVICKVVKHPLANAQDVKTGVIAIVDGFLTQHGDEGIEASYSLDSTISIGDSIGVLASNLALGALLVIIILTLFIGIRAASLTVTGMVFSFLGSLLYFKLTGESINELSLLGFIIVVGIVVDDAVVVIDSIVSRLEKQEPLRQAIIEGTNDVAWPVLASAATTIAAFLPLLMMSGVVGEFFSLIPVAVTVALVISVIEALFMLPLHTLEMERFIGASKRKPQADLPLADQPGILGTCARWYDRALGHSLRHPWLAISGAALLFFAAIGVLVQSALAPGHGQSPLLKLDFFPSDAAIAEVRITMPPDTPLERTDAMIRTIAADIAGLGVGSFSSATGIAGMQVDQTYKPMWGSAYGFIQAEVAGRATRTFDDPNAYIHSVAKDLVTKYQVDGVSVAMAPQQGGPPTGQPISVRLRGEQEHNLLTAAHDLRDYLIAESAPGKPLDGAIDITSDADLEEQVLTFIPDQTKLATYHIDPREAQQFIAGLFDGIYVNDLRRSDSDIPVRVRIGSTTHADFKALTDVQVRSDSMGAGLSYSDLGHVEAQREPANRIRRDYVRTIGISGNLDPLARITAHDCSRIINEWWSTNKQIYSGITLNLGGEAESTGRSYASLIASFFFAIALIYIILGTQFRSYFQPFLIMTNIIFAFTGVVLVMGILGGLALVLGPTIVRPERALFTMNSFIAVVGLTGMVVNNAIVLIDVMNKRRREGMPLREAITTSAHSRLRAILMTTLTTIVGLLPTAIGIPTFNMTWSPMALAFCAGLSMSTILTLLVLPACYEILMTFIDRWTPVRFRHVEEQFEAPLATPLDDTNSEAHS